MATKNQLQNVPPGMYHDLKIARWKARTDLGFLCREILNYPDVSTDEGGPWHALHQPLIDRLQRFPVPSQQQFDTYDRLEHGKWVYKSLVPILDLEGKKRRLILDSRSFLKTTINCIAHSIQWILNYPNISILLLMGSGDRASAVLDEIKNHFKYNPRFRQLFPEHCPQKNIEEFGTMNEFTTKARSPMAIQKEPTVMTGSIEKGAASYHFHVIKFSDIVDENNIQGNGLEMVRKKFDISLNLLINPRYWIDVEGTRYHFADTYGKIIDREYAKVPEKRTYDIYVRGALVRDVKGGEKFIPEESKAPFKKDENGRRISRWPENFPVDDLDEEEKNDPWLFACQKLNSPALNIEGATPFPVDNEFPKKISRTDFNNNIRVSYKEICVDFAETDNPRSNFTCITVGTVASDGRLYVEEIVHGRFLADLAVDLLFKTALKHYRHLRVIKMEDVAYTRGLMPTIQRKLDTFYRPKGLDFTIETIKRGNRTHKADRIHKAIQPWYKNGDLRFVDDIEPKAWLRLIKEMEEFPQSETDDILDTISDFLSEKEYFGRELARGNPGTLHRNKKGFIEDPAGVARIFKQVQNQAMDHWLQIEDPYDESLAQTPGGKLDPYYHRFGVY